jgi:histidinol phosphate aminotransferase apoenzyme (EC 2.6.1.9)
MFDINNLVRENIKKLTPYSSARDEFKGEAKVYLDANENSLGSPLMKWYNRYPDPLQLKVKEKLSEIKTVPPQNMFWAMAAMSVSTCCIGRFVIPPKTT